MYPDLTVWTVLFILCWAILGFLAMLIYEKGKTCSEHSDHFVGFLICGLFAFIRRVRARFICNVFIKEVRQDEKTQTTQRGSVAS